MANLPVQFPSDEHRDDPVPESNEHLLLHSAGAAVDQDSELPLDHEQVIQHILSDPNVTQHVTRTSCDGTDSLVGFFRCEFAPDQLRSILHVPLHPPMQQIPDVEALVVDQPDGSLEPRIRVTDRQKFGLRLEIVLTEPRASETRLMVEIIASSTVEGG